MPKATRRFHSKSRGGCEECKRVHLKCEEDRPICSRCTKRGFSCHYGETSDAPYFPSPGMRLSDAPENVAPRLDTLNLELLHHFSLHTWKTLDSSSVPPGWWQETMPKLALEYDHLMYALLALSSLHVTYCRPEQGQKYVQIAKNYREYTMKALSITFLYMDSTNATACFWSSAMIGLISFAMYQCLGDARPSSTSLLLEIATLWKGSRELQCIAATVDDDIKLRRMKPSLRIDLRSLRDKELSSMLDELRSAIQNDWRVADTDLAKYIEAIDDLVGACLSYEKDEASGDMLSWFSCLDSGVIRDFEAKVEAASLVVIFYGVALHQMRKTWFIQTLPVKIVEELSSTVSLSNRRGSMLVNRARERVSSVS